MTVRYYKNSNTKVPRFGQLAFLPNCRYFFVAIHTGRETHRLDRGAIVYDVKDATTTSLCWNVSHIGRRRDHRRCRRRKYRLAFSVSRYMQMRHMLSPRHIINYSCRDRRCIGGPKITYWSCQGHTRMDEARPRPKRVTSYGVRVRATIHVWSSYGLWDNTCLLRAPRT